MSLLPLPATWKLTESITPGPAGGSIEIAININHNEPHLNYAATGKQNFYSRDRN